MPELPEVETVRDGLARHVLGRTVTDVAVHRDYSVRRHVEGPLDFAGRLAGRRLDAAVRRGKFLWLLLDDEDAALMAHLGMSGQLLVRSAQDLRDEVRHPHLRVRLALDDGSALDFVDQRTFGHLSVPDLVPTPDGAPGGLGSGRAVVPAPVTHIARDLLDPSLDRPALVEAVRARRTGIKRALLDQALVSGIGNIYADEGLWRARLHYARPTDTLRRAEVERALDGAQEVMTAALAQGGTSFDALYVNVNGASGYFDRSLAVYGQAGRPCPRCGAAVRRDEFMNRSSYTCPVCQPRPRRARW
ncbi:bifunctional DNA-formamidopyrimidine glycosylase/DNA-(apurinic or apyrimidinic site) lyase [Cellulomonas fimi]|uniref:Formamidopyrimidine-DNA glycosylase n=1 Tax=Cellulomonas fimi (strain ATCC 484 / DSM 20113 / JCM 1341 / CCUG 24087 / LMG 16345 / NBRC 15513 / NCIMB 8980 / NCTC 7547 / NRS-133) TaxID=590998 RepID=F4H486_CELFA|nr:bifunctional DNA-formamidopyrimidine glycosylase/DNA-(apurinic or apyrimidinic site) lyase [Cellulomonas fimi]AEE46562.1 formamidopyrimidine-DNA glycosylase [Cellulomonas fimi ATCC 484]NNH08532.1 bifunctional DNA-formamidopyrimidine glycosylase/DNA-(apurinic or apyrimidinic site) lyase [Cellulomonas fimi]VEH33498.1 Formamidopyrimidine-DNA glycosylase [Cellulomonas fimi]